MHDPERGDLTPLVRDRAYFLWEEAGKPAGREHEFWAVASEEIEGDLRRKIERERAARHAGR